MDDVLFHVFEFHAIVNIPCYYTKHVYIGKGEKIESKYIVLLFL